MALLWVLSMSVLFATDAIAVGLRDVQASGNPGGMIEGQSAPVSPVTVEQTGNTPSAADPEPEQAESATLKKQAVHGVTRKRRKTSTSGTASTSLAGPTSRANVDVSDDVGSEQRTRRFGELSLSLSLTLSPPKNDSVKPVNPTLATDALQNEAIAKQKALDDLNVRIAAMERMLKGQQSQLSISTNSSTSGVADLHALSTGGGTASEVVSILGTGNEQSSQDMVAPVIQRASSNGPFRLFEMNWITQAIGLAVLLCAVPVLVWYRRHQATIEGMRGKSPALSDIDEKAASTHSSAVVQTTSPAGANVMKVPAHTEQKNQSILPPEYEMLEEAEIDLRFGHDKLAEEVLRDAIKVNPRNPQAYLTLLRIYVTREDNAAFHAVAQRMRSLGDESAWKKAAEMGRKLDPSNPIYR